MALNGERWSQAILDFVEDRQVANYAQRIFGVVSGTAEYGASQGPDWAQAALVDWCVVARDFASENGQAINILSVVQHGKEEDSLTDWLGIGVTASAKTERSRPYFESEPAFETSRKVS